MKLQNKLKRNLITNKIYHNNCLTVLKKIKSESISLILTDPPYHTTNLDFDDDNNNYYPEIYTELKRVLKPNGWFFCFIAFEMIPEIFNAGWKYKFNYIWIKPNITPKTINAIFPFKKHEIIGAFIKPELKVMSKLYFDKKSLETKGNSYQYSRKSQGPMSQYTDQCNVFSKDKTGKVKDFTKINDGKRQGNTILEYPNKPSMDIMERTEHPTQKPEGLLKIIINGYCPVNGIVLDPFAGSGSTLLAAKKSKRKFIGIEKDSNWYNLIKSRLRCIK